VYNESTVISFELENYEADYRIFYICKQKALMSYLQLVPGICCYLCLIIDFGD